MGYTGTGDASAEYHLAGQIDLRGSYDTPRMHSGLELQMNSVGKGRGGGNLNIKEFLLCGFLSF